MDKIHRQKTSSLEATESCYTGHLADELRREKAQVFKRFLTLPTKVHLENMPVVLRMICASVIRGGSPISSSP